MAFITHCDVCRTETLHHGTECLICKEKKFKNDKEEFLQNRNKMSIEERLLLLESDVYQHTHNHPRSPGDILYA
jgi:hypothetical protein